MSSFDERSEALKDMFELGETVGYTLAQQDLARSLRDMKHLTLDDIKGITGRMDEGYDNRFKGKK